MNLDKRLAIISDFHMDINQFSRDELDIFLSVLTELAITDIHFAGDISNAFHSLTVPFLQQLATDRNLSVTYNLGNHDMVGLSEKEISEHDFQVKMFGKTAFVSFHGWYDYSFLRGNFDVKKVVAFKNSFYFDRKIKRAFDDVKTTELILTKLENLLTELSVQADVERIIVSTHFVPHQHFIINTRYEKFARFNAYLGSQHFHEIFLKFPKVSDVIFGHIHHRMMAVSTDKINYHARPLGYTYEWEMVSQFLELYPQYKIPEIWHLRKRYQEIKDLPEWKEFRKQHLADEFLSALTVFDF
ncbi:MAG: metallophosphoesterase [Streptococcaceae bacterium]|nr:metallophosphoesterase [Streptococcaceae bacterium]